MTYAAPTSPSKEARSEPAGGRADSYISSTIVAARLAAAPTRASRLAQNSTGHLSRATRSFESNSRFMAPGSYCVVHSGWAADIAKGATFRHRCRWLTLTATRSRPTEW